MRAIPLLLRERVVLSTTLVALIALSWIYLVWMAADMAVETGATLAHCATMPGMISSGAGHAGWLVLMWGVMAIAMMLPTALPLVALYFRFHLGRRPGASAAGPTLSLVLGYLLVWFAFGALAALLQWGLEHARLAQPSAGQLHSKLLGGLVLLGAGGFQLSPLKALCLEKCRTPLGFIMTRWRDGGRGALAMGIEHGLHCLGCCWALMLVMFVVGAMNIVWMSLLAVVMLAEKVAPRGHLVSRIAGVGLVAAGVWLMAA